MKYLELLAPAKDLACALDAVNCGADAVYIGAERFGARAAAGNSISDIAKLTAYARKYRVKVYAALNTLLKEEELPAAKKLAGELWEAGIDGLIVQDMGLLEMELPPIPLIASTQSDNSSPEKVLFLEKTGFKRAILARELSLDEIKAIKAVTSIGLEFFVHGALCVSYSGRCYLSFALGGRSGNRGECAQPCRKLYTLKDKTGKILSREKHHLSLKDLNLSTRLEDLALAGITSFKIEGRLKDQIYVRNTVSFYRGELDRIMSGGKYGRPSLGKSFPGFKPDLAKTFNRGYTEYFLEKKKNDPSSPDTPKFTGEKIGTAYHIKRDSFFMEEAGVLSPGDGITFFDKNGRLTGTFVNEVRGKRIYADKLEELPQGAEIRRNLDKTFLRSAERAVPVRKLALELVFSEEKEGFLLEASDERGNRSSAKIICAKNPAEKQETALTAIKTQLSKLGGSSYYLENLELKLSKSYFISISALNGLRRETLASLEKISENLPLERTAVKIIPNNYPYPQKKLDFTGNVLNSRADFFYRRHGVKEISRAAEGGADITGETLMTTKFCIGKKFNLCGKPEPLYLEDEEGRILKLDFDCSNCLMKVSLEENPGKQNTAG